VTRSRGHPQNACKLPLPVVAPGTTELVSDVAQRALSRSSSGAGGTPVAGRASSRRPRRGASWAGSPPAPAPARQPRRADREGRSRPEADRSRRRGRAEAGQLPRVGILRLGRGASASTEFQRESAREGTPRISSLPWDPDYQLLVRRPECTLRADTNTLGHHVKQWGEATPQLSRR